jgi:hypothetical protein
MHRFLSAMSCFVEGYLLVRLTTSPSRIDTAILGVIDANLPLSTLNGMHFVLVAA